MFRIVAYRVNDSGNKESAVNYYNRKCRELLFGEDVGNEFIEGEFTEIDVILYRDGKKNKNHISTRPTTLDGYSIEFSKEFQDFRHMLHELALEYRKLVIDHGD